FGHARRGAATTAGAGARPGHRLFDIALPFEEVGAVHVAVAVGIAVEDGRARINSDVRLPNGKVGQVNNAIAVEIRGNRAAATGTNHGGIKEHGIDTLVRELNLWN